MEIDREGIFVGQIFGWGIKESNTSLSVAVSLSASMLEELDGAGNVVGSVAESQLEASGAIWYVGRNGKRRQEIYQNLKKWLGWSGEEMELLVPVGKPGALKTPPPCRIVVKRDDYYPDNVRYKIDSIGTRGGYIPAVDADEASEIVARIKSKIAGTYKMPEPEGTPPAGPPSGEVPF